MKRAKRESALKENLFTVGFFVLLALFCVSSLFNLFSMHDYIVPLFALALGIAGIFIFRKKRLRISAWWIFLPLALIILTNILPYLANHVPLGNYPGVYKYIIENFPALQPPLKAADFSPGYIYFAQAFLWLGMHPNNILIGLTIFLEIMLGLGIYLLAKRYFDFETGFFAALLYSISVIQFQALAYNYYEALLGLVLAVFAMYFYRAEEFNKFRLPFIALGVLLGITHKPIFLIFIFAYLGVIITELITQRKTRKFILDLAAGIIIFVASSLAYNLLFGDRLFINLLQYTSMFVERHNLINTYNFSIYTAVLWPLAIIGIMYCIRRKKFNFLFCGLIISLLVLVFGVPIYNAFIIPLNILVIVFAASGVKIVASNLFSLRPWFICALFGILLIAILDTALNARPAMDDQQMGYILDLGRTLPESKLFVADTEDYFWLLGYAERELINPYIVPDTRVQPYEWKEFLDNPDLRYRALILDRFRKPVYIYTGGQELGFNGTRCFEELNPVTYRYKC